MVAKKNKELGREELLNILEQWVTHVPYKDGYYKAHKQIRKLIQSHIWDSEIKQWVCPICYHPIEQSEEKPEITEEWVKGKAVSLIEELGKRGTISIDFIKDFIRQIVAEVRKVKTIQVGEVLFGKEEHEKQMARVREAEIDDIIDVVLGHVECHHRVDHDEDGVHETRDYDIDSEMIVKEKLRKILGG